MTDRIETLAVHAGAEPDPISGGVSPAIQMSATFRQDGVGKPRDGFEYGRSDNPTRRRLEAAIAALEGGTHGFAYSSGLAATQNLLYLLDPGDRLLMSDDVYGGTWRLADKVWKRYGVETDTVLAECGTHLDRRRDAAGDRVRLGAGVNGPRLEAVDGIGHGRTIVAGLPTGPTSGRRAPRKPG